MVHKQLSETKNTLIVPLESGAYVPYEITSWGNIVNTNPLRTFNEWRGVFPLHSTLPLKECMYRNSTPQGQCGIIVDS